MPSGSDRYDNWTIDPNITGILFGSPNTVRLGSGLIDSVYHFGILGLYGNSSPTTFSATELKIRSSIASSMVSPPYQLQRPARWSNPTAFYVDNPAATHFDIGILDLPDLGLGSGQRFANGLYFQSGGTGTRRIGLLGSTQGVTNLLSGSSDTVYFGLGHNGSFDVTLDDLTATNGVSANTLAVTTSAAIGQAANGLSLTVTGGAAGAGAIRILRDAVATNSIGVNSGGLTFREVTTSRTEFSGLSDHSTYNGIVLGGSATATPRIGYVLGEDASGTDIAAKNLVLRTGRGTGNATASELQFYSSTPGASGTSLQTELLIGTLQRDGDLDLPISGAAVRFSDGSAVSASKLTEWRDLPIPAGSFTPASSGGATATTAAYSGSGFTKDKYSFDASTDQTVYVSFPMPRNYDGSGTNIVVTIHWETTATTGNAVWAVQALWVRDGDNPGASLSTAVTVTDGAQGTASYRGITSATGQITPTGTYAAGCELVLAISRDADNGSDTLASAALLANATLSYKTRSTVIASP
jgi:hypothetical protein